MKGRAVTNSQIYWASAFVGFVLGRGGSSPGPFERGSGLALTNRAGAHGLFGLAALPGLPLLPKPG